VEVSLLDPGGGEVLVTAQTEIHRAAPHLMGIGGGVRAVAGDAAALAAEGGVRELGLVEAFLHVGVAGQTKLPPGSFHEDDLPFTRLLVAEVALLVGKGRVDEVIQQLRLLRPVRVVALGASGAGDGLAEVRFLERGVRGVVTGLAKLRLGLGQVKDPLRTGWLALVRGVAGGAAQVHRAVPHRLVDLRLDVGVAAEAEVFRRLPAVDTPLQQVFARAAVGIMTDDATPGAHGSVQEELVRLRLFVAVAGEAQLVALGGQSNLGFVLFLEDLVAGVTPHLDGRMHHGRRGFVGVAPGAGGVINPPAALRLPNGGVFNPVLSEAHQCKG